MLPSAPYSFEQIWDALLSRQPDQVRAMYAALTGEEQRSVIDHLRRMATEPDWHPEQTRSAKEALAALQGFVG